MVEETPSRMSVGAYWLLSGDDEELMDLSPVVLKDENNVTIDDDYSRKIAFRSRQQSLQAIMDDDSNYMQFEFVNHHEPTELNGLNFLNAMTIVIHLFVSLGIGLWGLDGLISTHWQVTQDFPTLVTPAKWMYYIWVPILSLQALFAFTQMAPSFRARPMIQDAIGFLFFYICLLQTAWFICFSFRIFIASFVLAVLLFVALVLLLIRQYVCCQSSSSHIPTTPLSSSRIMTISYWLFTLPFLLHCGWMAIMVVVNMAIMIRTVVAETAIAPQLAVDLAGLGVLMPLATWLLWSGYYMANDFCIPSVIICYYIGVAQTLRHPSDVLLNDYGETVVDSVQLTCYIMAGIVATLLIPRMLISIGHRFLRIQVVTMQEDSLTLE